MKLFQEGDLEFEFPDEAAPRKFDDQTVHKLAHCMKAVDCIFEWNGDTYFLEIKDPENPMAQTKAKEKFLLDFQSNVLNNKLTVKYRDSFIYEYASGRVKGKVHYVVMICMKNLDSHLLLNRSDGLKKSLPVEGPYGPWQRPFVSSCAVLNIDAWKRLFTQVPVRRLSEVVSGPTLNQK